MNSAEAIQKMWSMADKPERMRLFSKIVAEIGVSDNEQFWTNFWNIWQSSENLNEDFDFFPNLIERGLKLGDPHVAMDDDERTALAAMPDLITIYRGGIADLNEDGWSWTTDRSKARWFAERAYGDRNRVVLKGQARKKDVLTYLMGRSESEIVISPDDVIEVIVDEAFISETAGSGIFYAVQSGRLDQFLGSNHDRMRAEMMANTIRGPVEGLIAQIEEKLVFVKWADLRSQRGYMEALLDILKEKQADPDFVPVVGFSM